MRIVITLDESLTVGAHIEEVPDPTLPSVWPCVTSPCWRVSADMICWIPTTGDPMAQRRGIRSH